MRGGSTIIIKEFRFPLHRSLPLHRDAVCLLLGRSEIYPLFSPYLKNEDGLKFFSAASFGWTRTGTAENDHHT